MTNTMTISQHSLNSQSEAVYHSDDSRYDAVDLHCHSDASDGALSVAELVSRAASANLKWFSITDHDTLASQPEAALRSAEHGLGYVAGVEWSAVWRGYLIHVVGLNFDPTHPGSQQAALQQASARRKRCGRIAYKLRQAGFTGVEEWLAEQPDAGALGRPHFARFLVASGQLKSADQAFKRYLGAGKMGDVKAHWPALSEVVEWISMAGGTSVLAHPHRYRMTWTKRRELVADFRQYGGHALEIGVPGVVPNMREHLVEMAQAHQLMGSSGSDFHHDGQRWLSLGKVPPLPRGIEPVWHRF